MKIYNGYDLLSRNYTTATDEYEYTMGVGYLANDKTEETVFDVFFRKTPDDYGYVIMAGLSKVIAFIQNLKFGDQQISYFSRHGYSKDFINYLKNFKFHGDIYAIPDGTPVFPNEPILTVKAPLIEAQIVETAILNILNGSMEHATAARRILDAVPKGISVMEFGTRRSPDLEAGIDAALNAIMVGCAGTSNVLAADMVDLEAMGTMAHSWVTSFPDELTAFKAFAKIFSHKCILLVDTFDTLKSGVPNAIKTFKWMQEIGLPTNHIGIRIDSGDLAYLSKAARKMLNEAGFPQATICLSNSLTAPKIKSLINQGACVDSFGVGENLAHPNIMIGCVYKQAALNENGIWVPKIKLSNDTVKITNPGYKELFRTYDKDTGYAICDVMAEKGTKIPKKDLLVISPTDYLKQKTINNYRIVKLQQPIFIKGKLVYEDLDIMDVQKYCLGQMETLYPEIRRFEMPHEYYVDGTKEYVDMKNDLIIKTRQKIIGVRSGQ